MEFLGELWLPIVVSAVFVWIASFFMHMVFPHHKKEFAGLQNEHPSIQKAIAENKAEVCVFCRVTCYQPWGLYNSL